MPLYVGEVAPVARRGSLVGLYQLAFSFGLLLAQVPSEAAGDMDIDNAERTKMKNSTRGARHDSRELDSHDPRYQIVTHAVAPTPNTHGINSP